MSDYYPATLTDIRTGQVYRTRYMHVLTESLINIDIGGRGSQALIDSMGTDAIFSYDGMHVHDCYLKLNRAEVSNDKRSLFFEPATNLDVVAYVGGK